MVLLRSDAPKHMEDDDTSPIPGILLPKKGTKSMRNKTNSITIRLNNREYTILSNNSNNCNMNISQYTPRRAADAQTGNIAMAVLPSGGMNLTLLWNPD